MKADFRKIENIWIERRALKIEFYYVSLHYVGNMQDSSLELATRNPMSYFRFAFIVRSEIEPNLQPRRSRLHALWDPITKVRVFYII